MTIMSANYSILTYDSTELCYTKCADLAEILAHFNPNHVNWITLSGITLRDDYVAIKDMLNHRLAQEGDKRFIGSHAAALATGHDDGCEVWGYHLFPL